MEANQLLKGWLEELTPDWVGAPANELAALAIDICRAGIMGMAI